MGPLGAASLVNCVAVVGMGTVGFAMLVTFLAFGPFAGTSQVGAAIAE